MKATTNKTFIKLAKEVLKLGGEIDWKSSSVTRGAKLIFIDAPEGYYWSTSQADVICIDWLNGPLNEFYSEALEFVKEGVYLKGEQDG